MCSDVAGPTDDFFHLLFSQHPVGKHDAGQDTPVGVEAGLIYRAV